MSQLSRPIPALYAVYVLRSTKRHASIYIGSTPHPPRRLNQHNGIARGGAVRTAKDTLRPWEVIILITGFPSSIAALKFEWALTNPHLTTHISTEERITTRAPRKKGQRKSRKPIHSLRSVVSNLHLLVGSKKAWDNWLKYKETTPREGIKITEDYSPDEGSNGTKSVESWGIHALPLDYAPIKPYVEKAHNVVKFEREGNCIHCHEALESGKGLQPMCPHDGCEAMGHLDCWSKHALKDEPKETLLPLSCTCPSCGGKINWSDMMKELTLRVRGPKEVAKLLKKKRRTKKQIAAEAEAEAEEDI
ncbi:uncharacterized protein BKA55DRAFT_644601 [Fusarium redolens]|uniref:GIY-YIG domain-containing protein n=1 Tax=Fusarium redolens TaxID=48865 RepID=A0A9P9H5Q5_FUSRE|nr:uncharacterized protein BKA55DRAFT_644601 [Fusarium redolens]KAH7250282.1 hypothetical protein BKA55DRAFT_644601 [Fusarium redolens]